MKIGTLMAVDALGQSDEEKALRAEYAKYLEKCALDDSVAFKPKTFSEWKAEAERSPIWLY